MVVRSPFARFGHPPRYAPPCVASAHRGVCSVERVLATQRLWRDSNAVRSRPTTRLIVYEAHFYPGGCGPEPTRDRLVDAPRVQSNANAPRLLLALGRRYPYAPNPVVVRTTTTFEE